MKLVVFVHGGVAGGRKGIREISRVGLIISDAMWEKCALISINYRLHDEKTALVPVQTDTVARTIEKQGKHSAFQHKLHP